MLASVPITTVARLMGHTNPGFTLRAYAHDARDEAAVAEDVLGRMAAFAVGQ